MARNLRPGTPEIPIHTPPRACVLALIFSVASATPALSAELEPVAAPSPEASPAPKASSPDLEPVAVPADRNRLLAVPIVTYAPETGVAFGGALIDSFWLDDARDSLLRLDARYTTREQILVRARGQLYFGPHFLRGRLSYDRFPDRFYGIGASTAAAFEPYTPVELRGELEYERRLWSRLYAGVALETVHQRIEDVRPGGELATAPGLLGRGGGVSAGLGVQVTWDDRDTVNATREGSYARASLMAFHDLLGSAYAYRRATLDLRHFVPLGFDHTLALQGYARFNSGQIPFYDLALMGGPERMRGVYQGRYRDRHLVSLQAEYRLPLFWRIGLAGFIGAAQVGREIDGFDLRRPRIAGGGGFRFAVSRANRLNGRLDAGFSAEGRHLYFTFNEAF